ncbi:UbiA-like polyprenyltransferase [Marinicrinis lubricantis]|uniref:UbiA-like polyprenyltransferase n=1 Tax=Marinicrinis lubricantis TaxID=2086470 RepID=A0ABW1IM15_9BACL
MSRKLKIFLEMIKFEHTLFAMPFAFMGAILGSIVVADKLPSWEQIGWVTLAMVGARSAAMGLNRLIDKVFDGKNPRTAMRALPAGLLTSMEVVLFVAVSMLILFFAAFRLSDLAVKLLPVAVFFLVFYSYTKRFTWLCHLILGLTIGLAPLGGWVAVTGEFSWIALIFYISVAFWTAGFDIIYACQDMEFDRSEGLHSIPERFGLSKSLWIAKGFHLITAIGFISMMIMTDLSWFYLIGIVIGITLLYYEHSLVKPHDLSKINIAFFMMNGIFSSVVFIFTLIDVVVLYG